MCAALGLRVGESVRAYKSKKEEGGEPLTKKETKGFFPGRRPEEETPSSFLAF